MIKKYSVALLLLLFFMPVVSSAARWKVYKNATLIKHYYNDGDSFHVMCNKRHYIFRLYFVDAPETSNTYPLRVQEQADYFGVTVKQALAIGDRAAQFSTKVLSEKPFTLYTKKEDARGNSKKKRYFAMIKIGDVWLSSKLVDEGVVRIYGKRIKLPGERKPKQGYSARLRARERVAKKSHRGAWGVVR